MTTARRADATTVPRADATFADVFHTHRDRALRLAYLHCGDLHRAEDAVAEAMARVYRQWRKGRVRDVGPYLRQAVVNEVHAGGRRLFRDRGLLGQLTGDARGQREATDTIADRDQLVDALQELPERQRLAVVLRYFEDLSEARTAEVMGISVGGVKSQTSRGIERLRELLGEDAR